MAIDKRSAVRDRPLLVEDLNHFWDALREADDRHRALGESLQEHMRMESEAMAAINANLTMLTNSMTRLLEAMPEDDHGRVDFFGHKSDHVYVRDGRKVAGERASDFRKNITEIIWKIILFAAVIVVLGDYGRALLKAMA